MADNMPIIAVNDLAKSFMLGSIWGDASLKGLAVSVVNGGLRFLQEKVGMTAISKNLRVAAPPGGRRDHAVLKRVNLSINRGETLALIGRNGSGKSTLLKILAGVYTPQSGSVAVTGRVSPLIELGTGFHPEFSGRENILLNAQILGLTRAEAKARLDDIIDFAEMRDFVDYPVRTYSSGMYMRLGFAVAVNVDPDILLVDEILAVGDARFQGKCHDKLDEFKRQGKTIILVTHSMSVVESWTTRAVYLKDGEVVYDGKPSQAVSLYLGDTEGNADASTLPASGFSAQAIALSSPTLLVDGVYAAAGMTCVDAIIANEDRDLTLSIQLASYLKPELIERVIFKIHNQDTTVLIAEGSWRAQISDIQSPVTITCSGLDILVPGLYRVVVCWQEENGETHEMLRFDLRRLGLVVSSGFIKLPVRGRQHGFQESDHA